MTEQDNLQKSTESHRFRLAVLLIGGFLVIMFIALLGELLGRYSGLKDLAGIFSGWITAVIGFYFLQQNTERAQQQTREATREASEARKAMSLFGHLQSPPFLFFKVGLSPANSPFFACSPKVVP